MLNNLFHLQVPQLAAVPQQEVLQVDTDLIRFTRTAIKTVYEWFSEITHLDAANNQLDVNDIW